ncbi:MAG: sulfite exporter TauE/SafE family protein [Thermodesulfobacteriota bacterium]
MTDHPIVTQYRAVVHQALVTLPKPRPADMLTLAAIAVVFFLAGLVQGLTGFGSALVAIPLLALLVEARTAVPLCSLAGLAITGILSWQLRRHLTFTRIRPLLLGCLPGVVLGTAFLKGVDDRIFRLALGLFLVLYAGFRLAARPRPARPLHPLWAYGAGLATGVIGAAFSTGGPPTVIYTSLTGWSQDEIKATLSAFFLLGGLMVIAGHALAGLITSQVLALLPVAWPAVTLGVLAGARLSRRLDQTAFLRALLVLLLVMGLAMLASARA